MTRLAGIIPLILAALACSSASSPEPTPSIATPDPTPVSGGESGVVEVVGSIPHEGAVWTEGLQLDGGLLWESSGRPTGSGVRALDPDTGEVQWSVSNDEAFFAEGLVRAFGRTYVLSFQEGTVFTFDRERTSPFQPFAQYEGEGWGLTAVEDSLLNSNGSATLFYRDPDTFAVEMSVKIRFEGEPVQGLNELEYDGRYVWVNQRQTRFVYRIDEGDPGRVVRYELPADFCPEGHPNGIAWDAGQGLFYITGQRCEEVWRVRFR